MTGTFIGRQAIYDRSLRVVAYELLYRLGRGERAPEGSSFDGDRATGRVLINAFLELGAQQLVGELPCFVNLTRGFITGELPLPLPPDRVVIEVLEDIEPDPEILAGVARLKGQGVKVALDDYVHREGNEALLPLCDYVKVDLRAQDREETARLRELLGRYDLKLLAEKVETMDELEWCQELGFDYFQGFFLTKPEVVEGHKVLANHLGLMRMLARLLDPQVELEELEQLIAQDVSLAYMLLRYANSARIAPRTPITAIGQTIMMLGLSAVRKIVSLIILVELDERPGDLISQSLIRARMCERLAEELAADHPSSFYTAGLLSTLDAVAGAPMETVVENLSLSEELEEALVRGEGEMGRVLRSVKAFEAGDWDHGGLSGLDSDTLTRAYAEGVEYSRSIQREFDGGEELVA